MVIGGDAFEPALLREFFMVGEIEPHEKANPPARFGGGFCTFGFLPGLSLFRLGGRGGSCFCGFGALKFEKKLFVQPKGLLPAVEFVPGVLCSILVLCEIENQVSV